MEQARSIEPTSLSPDGTYPELTTHSTRSFHGMIEHVEYVRETLREWKRILRPGGVMVHETPDAASPKVRRLGTAYGKFWAPEHTYTFTHANLSRFFQAESMTVVTRPALGIFSHVPLSHLAYMMGYQSYHALRRALGIEKCVQIYALKPTNQVEFQSAA